jgi:hypothetical protein
LIDQIKNFLFNPLNLYATMISLGMLLTIIWIFKLDVKSPVKSMLYKATIRVLTKNATKEERRKQAESIEGSKRRTRRKYVLLVARISESLSLGLSLENFNLMLILISSVAFIGVYFYLNSFIMASFTFFPILAFVFVIFLQISKTKMREKDEAVMNAKDILAPLVKDKGVMKAIRDSKRLFEPSVKPHFDAYIRNIEQNVHPSEAMDMLEDTLGPKFYSFARKAKVFEFNETPGMARIFEDEVEMNKVQRTTNYWLDEGFKEINIGMFLSIASIALFLGFMFTNPMTGDYMKTTLYGKFVTSVSITVMLLIYVLNQLNQLDIDYDKLENNTKS